MNDDVTTIEGTLMRVANPYHSNYFKLGVKTDDDRRILLTLNTHSMGWNGKLRDSIIWYRQHEEERDVKIAMSNPERYIGERLLIKGVMTSLDAANKKYKISNVEEIVLLLK